MNSNMIYRTIIVDDEPPALAKLSYLLKDYKNFELVGSFYNANDAINSIDSLQPQVAFLDIAMPGKNGMELASILKKKLSNNIKIIFVTAFDQYAVSAFDVEATDYLLKPVNKERFQRSISRIIQTSSVSFSNTPVLDSISEQPMLHAFGKLEITGAANPQPEWRTAKVRELFALFLQNRPNGVFKKKLLDILWDNLSEEKALSNLNTCNYYLRSFLKKTGTDISLKYKSGYYSLDLGSVICDLDIFDNAEVLSTNITSENINDVLYGASLYRGKYFEDIKCDWANLLRDQYDIRYVNLRVAIGKYYTSIGSTEEANQQATLALEIDQLCENAWQILLTNYFSTDKIRYEHTLSNREIAYTSHHLSAPETIF